MSMEVLVNAMNSMNEIWLTKSFFQGQYCQTKIPFCSETPDRCQNGGHCVDHFTHFKCECAPGFGGDDCSQNIDECAEHMCQVWVIHSLDYKNEIFRHKLSFVAYTCHVILEWRRVRGRHQLLHLQVPGRVQRRFLRDCTLRRSHVPPELALSAT